MVKCVGQYCWLFLRRALEQSGFREADKRMQCVHKPMMWRKSPRLLSGSESCSFLPASDIVISKCLRAHYLYEAFRAGFTGSGAIMKAPRLPGSSAGERKL